MKINTNYKITKINQPNPSKVSVFWIGNVIYAKNLETNVCSKGISFDEKDDNSFLKAYSKAEKEVCPS